MTFEYESAAKFWQSSFPIRNSLCVRVILRGRNLTSSTYTVPRWSEFFAFNNQHRTNFAFKKTYLAPSTKHYLLNEEFVFWRYSKARGGYQRTHRPIDNIIPPLPITHLRKLGHNFILEMHYLRVDFEEFYCRLIFKFTRPQNYVL